MSKSAAFRKAKGKPAPRRHDVIPQRQSFLIVCEGEKTEPNYFRKYRVPKFVVEVLGIGGNTITVVEAAIKLKKAGKQDFDQLWCVFDRDSFPAGRFNAALELARQNDIRVAYSNEAFELWYLLHFIYTDSAIARNLYIEKLKEHLGDYKKNSEDMYDNLRGRRGIAMKNAATLMSRYDPPNPENDNPSTTVHLLVEELLKNSPR
jgi:hypothetical protein